MKIRIKTGYNERKDCYYFNTFETIDKLPEIGDLLTAGDTYALKSIDKVAPDAEEASNEAACYDFYELEYEDEDGEKELEYVAVKKALPRYVVSGGVYCDDLFESDDLKEAEAKMNEMIAKTLDGTEREDEEEYSICDRDSDATVKSWRRDD